MTTTGPRAARPSDPEALPPAQPRGRTLLRDPWVRVTAVAWAAVNIWVLVGVDGPLPFEWPNASSVSISGHLLDANLALAQVFLLMVLTFLLTRRRRPVDLQGRAPERGVALRETLLLLGYGGVGLIGGYLLARSFGWQPFGLHLAGTLHAHHDPVQPVEAVTWAGYNVVVYAVVPLLYFRRRYSARSLNMRSTDRRNDALVILAVLVVETASQLLVLQPELFDLTARQLTLGLVTTFLLYLAGAVLPAMVFIYAILVPRYLRLTGSTAGTVVLGGLTYTALHVWDSWAVFDSPGTTLLSLTFLLLTYFGPGMIKTYLTVRTGNAWVHVWAYHALSPHTLVDTPHTVNVFRIG